MNKKYLMYIFLFTLLLRIPVFLHLSAQPIRFYWNSDSYNYELIARNLIQYQTFSGELQPHLTPNVYRTPIYPLFIAVLFYLSNYSVVVTVFIQVLLSCLMPPLMMVLVSTLKLPSYVGWISAGVLALNPLVGLISFQLTTETVFVTLLVLAMLMLSIYLKNRQWGWLLGSAVFFSLASLTRPISQYLPFILIPVFFLAVDKTQWRLMGKGIFLFLIVNILITYSWAYRNYAETGLWTLSAISNQNLLYYRARDVYVEVENVDKAKAVADLRQFIQTEVETKHLTTKEELQLMSRKAIDIFKQNPYITIKVHVKGFLRVMGNPGISLICATFDEQQVALDTGKNILGCEANQNSRLSAQIQESLAKMTWFERIVLAWEVLLLGFLLLASAFGVFQLLRDRQWVVLYFLVVPVVYFALLSSGGESNARYRIPLIPFLAVLAGIGSMAIQKTLFSKRLNQTK
ncbi:MAG: glycosyltransferase family 39 protein [Anaerolineales bacterium]